MTARDVQALVGSSRSVKPQNHLASEKLEKLLAAQGFSFCSITAWGDLPFRVELWDAAGARIETVLAASADLKLGKAAFAEAVRLRPNERILLRHKTRVICDNGTERPTTHQHLEKSH